MTLIPRPVKNVVFSTQILLEALKAALRCKVREEREERSQLHRYILFSYNNKAFNKAFNKGNIGDNIQTIATKCAISKIDGQANFVSVQRDQLIFRKNKPLAICVMQGWFEHGTLNFLPGPSVVPVWIGTHWQNHTRAQLKFLLRLRPNALRGAEIGCRDKSTLKFCKEQEIPAYFSRCLTLTLPRRTIEPKLPQIFIVNCPDWIVALLPQHVKGSAVFVDQREVFLDNEKDKIHIYEGKAEELLARYRDEAGLVITTALHCAQPCIAMGIPVVFINPHRGPANEADRFSAMQGIIPIWTKEDLENGRVDFYPKAPDIEDLKALMIENLDLSIRKAKNLPFDAEHLQQVRQKIEAFSVA